MVFSLSDWCSIASALGTVGAVIAALIIYKGTVRASSKPVLVFSVKYGSKWQLQNVGNGPALDIIVYELHGDQRVENATRCHPLTQGGIVELSWLKVAGILIVVFSDSHGNWFTMKCANSTHELLIGDHRPDADRISHQWLQEILSERHGSLITEEDLQGKSWEELDVLRNTPYARRGLTFRSREDLDKFFRKTSWYSPTDLSYDAIANKLTKREIFKSHFILDYQVANGLTRPLNALITEEKIDRMLALGLG